MKIVLFDIDGTLMFCEPQKNERGSIGMFKDIFGIDATGSASLEELRQYSDFVFEDFGQNRWQEAVRIIKSI